MISAYLPIRILVGVCSWDFQSSTSMEQFWHPVFGRGKLLNSKDPSVDSGTGYLWSGLRLARAVCPSGSEYANSADVDVGPVAFQRSKFARRKLFF